MNRAVVTRCLLATVLVVPLLSPEVATACSVCFGKSDSAMAKGMNMGIFALLGTIGFVLSGVAAFFIFVVRKSADVGSAACSTELSETVSRT